MVEVKLISAEETYEIRHKVLRPNQNIESCKFPSDNIEGSFDLGAFFENKLVSIASFYPEKNENVEGKVQYRLRGMATLDEYRNLKAGSALIKYGEKVLKERQVDAWWCNARVTASGYYKKLGLSVKGDVFDIPGIGPHKLMYKHLS
ncbi:GNAT family N-acetyltransferase [Scopulibacillus cellulosilyticus]|uniref:GNAT family N-acetyltransferase n=1 Tax=Scopulibacillus cellulosilyticus TaxID=2665665 RepID=A0ABW2PWR1_9BACL